MTLARLSISRLILSRGERVLFQGLSLDLTAGEAVALTGANGAGKTSLLRAVAGFIRPDAGTVACRDPSGEMLDPQIARARHVHLLGHQDGLKPVRTARQELAFQTAWCGGADVAAAVEALELTAL